ncbi:MAG: glycosyltransferase family 87 protein, partial [Candidatus Omnitrophota bacterium]
MTRFWKWLSVSGLFIVGILISVGIFRAYLRGANDFFVFYQAWKWVLLGQGDQIYRVSPDRFLYSPGFAWLLSPFALLSRNLALAIWCLIKVFFIGLIIKKFSEPWQSQNTLLAFGISAWGVVLVARPLLIDFEYGQVNIIILGVCVWGILGHFEKKNSFFWDPFRWLLLTTAAVAKLYPLPLLLVPWAIQFGISKKKLKFEKYAIFLGILISILIPVFSQGWAGTWSLFLDWREAIMARGLPLESHNQSFSALIYHYLSGNPTAVLSEGGPILLGQRCLSAVQISFLSLFWTSGVIGIILGWIVAGSNHSPFKWTAMMIGLLIVPSHLVWKP